ncbi:peptidylprolyl isomerase [Candidatus Micrarchaeota archaeon]|nr:peptidylprolyl isomerase [Candidatus Micrarchaeota archaeon]
MALNVSKNDLVELEYSAKAEGQLFDTTSADAAKTAGIFNEKAAYGPVLVAVGKGQVIPGLDDALQGAEEGKAQSVKLPPEKAFGNRNPDLVRLVPLAAFREQKIDPYPGLVLEMDGRPAKVQSVDGGRVRVDFNSDLAGKTVQYDFTVKKVYRSAEDKAQALGRKLLSAEASFKDGSVSVKLALKRDMAADVVLKKFRFIEQAFSVLDGVTSVKFEEEYTA